MDQGRHVFQGLDQVRFDGVLQERRHGAGRVDIGRRDGLAVVRVGDDNAFQPFLEVVEARAQAQDGHHFRGDGNVEAVFPGHAGRLAAKARHDVAQFPVVHVDDALPDDAARIDAQGIALMKGIIHHGRQEHVGRGDGMKIPGEMQVDVFHRDDLGVAAARRAALDAEHRAEGGLTQADHGLLADLVERVGQADGGGGLALAAAWG